MDDHFGIHLFRARRHAPFRPFVGVVEQVADNLLEVLAIYGHGHGGVDFELEFEPFISRHTLKETPQSLENRKNLRRGLKRAANVAGADTGKRALDLRIDPKTKGLRLISLRSPFYVRGPFSQPDVSVDKGVLAMKAGSAIALATIAAPVAALLPLINTGPGEDSDCARLLSDAREKPKAPPPGKTQRR